MLRWIPLFLLLLAWPSLPAQETKGKKVEKKVAKKEENKTPAEPNGLGVEVKRLAKLAGTFEAKVKLFLPGSDKPQEATGVMKRTLILEGRYLQEEYEGTLLPGVQFHGKAWVGYDPFKKKYVSVWIDNHSTTPMISHGVYDEKTKSFQAETNDYDPAGKGPVKGRDVLKILDDNRQHFEMFRQPADGKGKETKVMEIDYTRKK